MGNDHVLPSHGNSSDAKIVELDDYETNYNCPWANAALMTVGDISLPDVKTDIDLIEFNILELQQFHLSNINLNANPRGPPIS